MHVTVRPLSQARWPRRPHLHPGRYHPDPRSTSCGDGACNAVPQLLRGGAACRLTCPLVQPVQQLCGRCRRIGEALAGDIPRGAMDDRAMA
jgi:hypothetical protein